MAFKEREPQYIPSALNTPMLNYREYYMSTFEKIQNTLLAFFAGGIVGLIFYGGQFLDEDGAATTMTMVCNVFLFVLIGMISVFFFLPIRKKQLKEKRKMEITHQFRELLTALAASLSSGMNVQSSLKSACNDLILEYSENAYIVCEVKEMLNGLENNIPIDAMLTSFGDRSEIEDIKNFGVVFSMCYRTGGSLKDVVRRTNNIISEKIVIREEIETTLSSNKTQFSAMMLIPVVMVLMIRTMSSTFSASFATPAGIVATTVAIGIFIAAFKLGQSIMNVKG